MLPATLRARAPDLASRMVFIGDSDARPRVRHFVESERIGILAQRAVRRDFKVLDLLRGRNETGVEYCRFEAFFNELLTLGDQSFHRLALHVAGTGIQQFEHLLEAGAVSAHHGVFQAMMTELDAALVGQGADQRQTFPDHGIDRDRLQ